MQTFWDSAQYDVNPEGEFRLAWAHVADAFARHSVRAQPVELGQKEVVEHSGQVIFGGSVGAYLDDRLGFRWVASHLGPENSKRREDLGSCSCKVWPPC